MKAFLKKILVFALLLTAVFILLSFLPFADGFKKNYYFVQSDKLEYLEKTKSDTAKRIVFIGGSSLTFGLDSKRISDSLNIEVYNTAVHGGLGVDYSIEVLKKRLNPLRDILVIGYEFPFVEDPAFYTEARIIADYLQHKPLCHQLWYNPKKLKTLVLNTQLLVTNFIYHINPYKTGYNDIYRRDGFNKYGDIITHLDTENMETLGDSVLVKTPSQDFANLIKTELSDFRYYIISPPFRLSDNRYQKQELAVFNNFMKNNFNEKYILNTSDASIENRYYFELPYHLNKDGRQIHTTKIIRALQNQF
ncbi:MAG: hypothetical protein U9R19_11040 [Bacteroidota bacterium]|nr:hypothetical protein [Bacteroidota bacterium]